MELKEKQRKILEVAVELFKEKGYMGSSVRDLATKLNIKAASLYAHIRSKEEILEWICFGIAQEFFEELQEVKVTDIDPKEKLNLFLDRHLSVVLKTVMLPISIPMNGGILRKGFLNLLSLEKITSRKWKN